MRFRLHSRPLSRVRQGDHFANAFVARFIASANKQPLPVGDEDRKQRRAFAQLPANLDATILDRLDVRSRVAIHGHQRGAQRKLEPQLQLIALRRGRQRQHEFHAALELVDGFSIGRNFLRALTGLQPVRDRLLEQRRFRVVLSQQIRLRSDDFGETSFQHLGDALMTRLPFLREHRAIRCILKQCVFEDVIRRRALSFLEEDLGMDELVEFGAQFGFGLRAARQQQFKVEFATNRRGELNDFAIAGHAIEPSQQQIVQRRRDRVHDRRRTHFGGSVLVQHARFDDQAGELFDEQRDAVRSLDHLLHDRVRDVFAIRSLPHHLTDLPLGQSVERDLRLMRLALPRGLELRPEREQAEHSAAFEFGDVSFE